MSSTNRGEVREYDHYATPKELADLIVRTIKKEYGDIDNILEPGCGEGVFLEAIDDNIDWCNLIGVEKNPKLANYSDDKFNFPVVGGNYFELDFPKEFDWVIGNPPFKLAQEFIEKSLEISKKVGFLLRLNYLGGQKRYKTLWSKNVVDKIYIFPARPGFTPNGKTDSIEYMFCVFDKDAEESTFEHIDNRDINNKWQSEDGYVVIEE